VKKIISFLLIISFYSCTSTDDGNHILPNVPVSETVYLNLHNALQHTGGSSTVSGGISGIIIYNIDNTRYMAWDAACPHLAPNECTAMALEGLLMVCSCDKSKFSILDGSPQSGTKYAARQYRVVKDGNTLLITNF